MKVADEQLELQSAQMKTLAEKLGDTPHLSPMLRKLRRWGFSTREQLLALAVRRGCFHYAPPGYDGIHVNDPGVANLSDLEVAMGLISGAQTYDPQLIRCAAQLLGSPRITPSELARQAEMERCVPVLRHIADAALQYDEEGSAFWGEVLARLAPARAAASGVLPHASRFMLQTGVVNPRRPHRPRTVWLRPRRSESPA